MSVKQKKGNLALACVAVAILVGASAGAENNGNEFYKKKLIQEANRCLSAADYVRAVQMATEAIKISPRDADGYLFRARIWIRTKLYANAIKDFTSAIQLAGKQNAQYYRYRGDCWVELQQYDKGITDYTISLHLDPDLYKSLYYRARAYALAGQKEKALEDIQRGIDLASKGIGTHHKDWFLILREVITLNKPIPYNPPVSN